MTEIYLDDYHLHSLTTSLPTYVRMPLQGLDAPDVRVDAYNNPGEDGQTLANVLLGGRLVTLEGRIKGEDAATYRTNRKAFTELIGVQRDSSGRPTPRVLKIIDAAGDEYRLNCVVQSLRSAETYPTLSDWQLQLRATGPIESETQRSLTITLPLSGGLEFPWTFPITFGASSGGAGTATNDGTLYSYPILTFSGPMTNPVLYNDTTGTKMGLTLTLGSGDMVVVDMFARTIVQGGSTNRMGNKSTGSSFWALAPGDNTLRFAASEFDAGTVTLTWRDALTGL